jgi:hypothetical protein
MFGSKTHRLLFVVALCCIAIGLPLNKIVLSLAGMLLSLNWILEADFQTKWLRIKQNKLALLLLSFFLFHILGLAWSDDIAYGFHDIKIKLPLLFLPLVISSSQPLSRKELNSVLYFFLGALFVTSLINFSVFTHDGLDDDLELRNMSLFTSHIRYALLIVFGFCIAGYYAYKNTGIKRFGLLLVCLWFVYYTFYAEVLSGVLALLCCLFFVSIWWVFKYTKRKIKYVAGFGLFALLIGVVFVVFHFLQPIEKEKLDFTNLTYTTPSGNTYTHILENDLMENGHYVYFYLCYKELEEEWNKVSLIPYSGKDAKGNSIAGTLIRYMTSKGLRKDGTHFQQLTTKDIYYIEQGVASVVYLESGIEARLAELSLEYRKFKDNADPNGSTVLQRLEYWKTGRQIIRDNFWFGVGTGDVQQTFDVYYSHYNSRLVPENRFRTHQQFMTNWIAFGVFGFCLFIGLHIYFGWTQWKKSDLIPFLFLVIILCSYLTEDTLETQVGVTFVAFFLSVFSNINQKND